VARNDTEASSNGRTADFGSAYEGSNPSASASTGQKPANLRAELKPLGRPPHVLLVTLGNVPHRLLADASAALRSVLGLATKNGPSLDRPQYAFNESRGQYHAPAILRRLSSLRGGTTGVPVPVVGLVDVDLFLPDAAYVIADADRDAGAAVFSTSRLSQGDAEQLRRRTQVESVHAAGHLLGLSHCSDYRCAMFLSRDAADSDRKGPGLCTSCRTAVGSP
jgi:archaemetzincin